MKLVVAGILPERALLNFARHKYCDIAFEKSSAYSYWAIPKPKGCKWRESRWSATVVSTSEPLRLKPWTVSTSSMLRLKENTGWAAGQRKEREPHLAVAVTTDRRGLEGGERRAKECQGHCQHGRSHHADRDRPAHLRGLR